jgi:hypothetical protein
MAGGCTEVKGLTENDLLSGDGARAKTTPARDRGRAEAAQPWRLSSRLRLGVSKPGAGLYAFGVVMVPIGKFEFRNEAG